MLQPAVTRWLVALVIGSLVGFLSAPASSASPQGTESVQRAEHGLPDVELLLRAGRFVPPGLTATRARERETERSAALAKLAERMAPDAPERALWMAALASVLAAPSDDDLWTCAARVVGDLGLYDLDGAVAAGLPLGGLVREGAVRSLRALFGVCPDPAQAFVRPFEPGPSTAFLLARLRESEANALALRFGLLATDPALALSALSDPDAAVRAEAARACAAAVRDGRLPAATPQEILFRQLTTETSPAGFHAELEALLALTAGLDPDAPPVAQLRAELAKLAVTAPPVLMLSLARALARLPSGRDTNPLGPTLRAAQQELASLLGRAIATRHGDVDVIAGVLASLQDLFSRIQPAVEGPGWVRNCEARAPLMRILSRSGFTEGVRTAAAGTLGLVAVPADVEEMLRVLREEGSGAGLRYALLGSLASLAETYPETAEAVVATLLEYLDHANADLRRRALSLLSLPKLGDHVRGRSDLSRMIDRLDSESVPELRSALLDLVKRYGDASMLAPLLAHATFDKLASGSPARVTELGGALRQLSANDPGARMKSARRLAQVPDPDTALARLVQCLELVAELTPEEALALGVEDHQRIVEWALELRSGGVLLSEALRGGGAFLRRLVELHLTRVPEGTGFTLAKRLYARALFLAEIVALGDASQRAETLSSFERALALAVERGDGRLAARVRRDRARFAITQDLGPKALEDLRLLAADREQAFVLELRDLRMLSELLTREGAASDPNASAESCDVLLALVRRTGWSGEPAAVRLQDLRNLVQRSRAAGDPPRLRATAALLTGLPNDVVGAEPTATLDGTNGTDGTNGIPGSAESEVPVWSGLVREPEWLAELKELASSIERALGATGPTAPVPPAQESGKAGAPSSPATGIPNRDA